MMLHFIFVRYIQLFELLICLQKTCTQLHSINSLWNHSKLTNSSRYYWCLSYIVLLLGAYLICLICFWELCKFYTWQVAFCTSSQLKTQLVFMILGNWFMIYYGWADDKKHEWNRATRKNARIDVPMAKTVQELEEEKLQKERFEFLQKQTRL